MLLAHESKSYTTFQVGWKSAKAHPMNCCNCKAGQGHRHVEIEFGMDLVLHTNLPSIVERSWDVKNEKQMRLKHSEIQREAAGITMKLLRDRNGCNRVPDV